MINQETMMVLPHWAARLADNTEMKAFVPLSEDPDQLAAASLPDAMAGLYCL